ncbi:MAG: cytochrome c family protein [Pseudomonadota bacterium]|uniref:c-type cytochrome n=1 Tax=unclassified Phenylobacterium TaxID=2640670 RepID=UPI000A7C56AD|nr:MULTISPECIES: cytochrome c family protein [unclassified Phenylobacterium]MBT9472931.1 cytochrome c family protein [Phenylobacterium sp.]
MRNAVMLSVVGACALLAACGQGGGEKTAEAPAAPATPEPTAAEKQALLAALPAPYNTADLANGKQKFGMCRSCHTIVPGGANMTGPNLHGVFGRKAGEVASYKYSDAVKNAGFVWDADHLDKWLAEPRTFLPGTKMSFAGLKDPKDRIDLIAYLKVETGYKAP